MPRPPRTNWGFGDAPAEIIAFVHRQRREFDEEREDDACPYRLPEDRDDPECWSGNCRLAAAEREWAKLGPVTITEPEIQTRRRIPNWFQTLIDETPVWPLFAIAGLLLLKTFGDYLATIG